MKVSTGTWDVRCPRELGSLFPERKGYYFRVDAQTAKKVLHILSKAYNIPEPALGKIPAGSRDHAQYEYDTKQVFLYPRNHLKTIFHEFYHHLDNMTDGMYDSDDREGGLTSLAWIFADQLWEQFTHQNKMHNRKRHTMKKHPQPDSPGEGIELEELLLASPIVVKGKRRRPKRDGCNGTPVGEPRPKKRKIDLNIPGVVGGVTTGLSGGNRRPPGEPIIRLHEKKKKKAKGRKSKPENDQKRDKEKTAQ